MGQSKPIGFIRLVGVPSSDAARGHASSRLVFRSDDVPECYNRVRYIRDSCKVFSDLWKTEKDFVSENDARLPSDVRCALI
jgi:hypothetical protein